MHESQSRPRGRDFLEELLEETVAEAMSANWASSDDPAGVWNRSGSRKTAERTLTDLTRARDESRALLEGSTFDDGNEFAIGAADNRVYYTVGDAGLKYEVVPVKGQQPDAGLIAEAQQFVDLFVELNNLHEIEKETIRRYDRDGDVFLRLYDDGGIPEVDFIQPERVIAPANGGLDLARAGESCEGYDGEELVATWGVVRAKKNRRKVYGYCVDEDCDGKPVFVPEREICHLKANVTSEWDRGWPTFEPVRRSLIRAEELLVAMTASGKARAKIAIITSVPGWNAQKAEDLKARLETKWQNQPSGEPPKEESTEQLPYAAHLRVRDGTNVTFPPNNLGAEDTIKAIQANLRTAGQRMNMPEWMFTGLADQKYSNAFVVEAPSCKMFQSLQGMAKQFFAEGRLKQRASLIWRAMRIAAQRGMLSPAVLRMVTLKASAPSLETRDKTAEANANSTYIDKQVKSRETCMEEQGLDPEREKQRIEAESKLYGLAGRRSGLLGGEEPTPEQPPDASGIPPGVTGEALQQLAGKWFAEMKGGTASGGGTFPEWLSEHFGTTAEGESWVSEAVYGFVGEADRSHLTKKQIEVTRKGKTYTTTVYVRKDTKASRDKRDSHPQASHHEATETAVRDSFSRAGKLTHEEISTLGDSLKTLPRERIQQLNREFGRAGGKTKADAANRLLEHVRAKQKEGKGLAGGTPHNPSLAEFRIVDADTEGEVRKVLPHNTAHNLPAAACGVNGASVYVSSSAEGEFSTNTSGGGVRAMRTFQKDGRGKLVCHNEYFSFNKETANQTPGNEGLTGTDVFANQVKALREMGVSKITTTAAGDKRQADMAARGESGFNGYYTWARLGYDGPISKSTIKKLPPEIQKQMGKSNRLLRLFEIPGGPEAWKEHGSTTNMTFDLSPNSPNIKALERYMASRRDKKATNGT